MRQGTPLAPPRRRGTPGFTAIVLASLACGMGLNILIFCFTSPVLFKGVPYPAPDRLVDVAMAPPGKPDAHGPLPQPLYVLLRDRTSAAFEAIGVFDGGRSENLSGDAGGFAERMDGHRITATGLAALGAAPQLGRLPTTADEQTGATPTMVLSYALWQRRFGGRTDVVNQTVKVDGQPTQILGVMPEGFGLLDNSSDAWFTYAFTPAPGQEGQHTLRGVGRLKPGVSMAQAQAAVKVALDEYAQTFPTRDKGWTVEITPWRDARFGGLHKPLAMVQLGVGVILLFLCLSVAVLLRSAMAGQSSPGVVLKKSLMLSLGGGLIGAVLAAWELPRLLEIAPTLLPRLNDVRFDAGAVAFSLILCVLTALVVGIVPAWRASRDVAGSGGIGWTGRIGAAAFVVLVAVQMALAFVLMAGAGLAIRAHGDMQGRDLGINTSGLLSFDVYLPRDPYITLDATRPGNEGFNPAGPAVYDRIRTALQTMPGVVQAAGVGTHPFASNPFVQCWIGDNEHTPDNQINAQYLAVTENYFNTMGIHIDRGRDFSSADQPDSPWVVLVNETLAKQQWPSGDPIGQKLTLTFQPNDEEAQRQIIGVVADTIPFRGASEVPPLIYVLHRQQAAEQRASLEGRRTVMSFVSRTTADPLALGDGVRALVGKVDATTPVTSIKTVEAYANAGQTVLLQFVEMLLGIFALVALVVGAAGVYALTTYGVMQRRGVVTLVLRALAAVVAGAVVGLAGWLRLAGLIVSFLSNLKVTPSDPAPLVFAGGVLAATALVACLVPALRAKRVVR